METKTKPFKASDGEPEEHFFLVLSRSFPGFAQDLFLLALLKVLLVIFVIFSRLLEQILVAKAVVETKSQYETSTKTVF